MKKSYAEYQKEMEQMNNENDGACSCIVPLKGDQSILFFKFNCTENGIKCVGIDTIPLEYIPGFLQRTKEKYDEQTYEEIRETIKEILR